ncbi:MAG: hypothetical protein WAM75_18785 [Xanthobacteraceae bacterium]
MQPATKAFNVGRFFEKFYYTKLPVGRPSRLPHLCRHVWVNVVFAISRRFKLRWRIWFGQSRPAEPAVLVKQAIGS